MELEELVASKGGLVATHELLAAGFTNHRLTEFVRHGSIVRVRQGWYLLPGTARELTWATRVGGRLGCVSAARLLGLSVVEPRAVHVVVPLNAARLRDPRESTTPLAARRSTEVVVHWTDDRQSGTRRAQSAISALTTMAGCQPVERTIAAADSALRLNMITRASWTRVCAGLPKDRASLLRRVDARSESITESIARFRLEQHGYRPRVQVKIPGLARIDLLLGGRLAIELDGWEFHKQKFDDDRSRDAQLAALGIWTLRFTYSQVMSEWPEVRRAIEGALRTGLAAAPSTVPK